ncbi:MAG: hypothetical protein ACJAY5_001488 [Actinomycetes bacterium]|jgi:hypothetical protein
MLAYEDETARPLFAVYVRPNDGLGRISFYSDEPAATDDVGPGMPPGVITHGDTYVEYIGDAILYAPQDWPLVGVNPDLLVQLATDDVEIFVALTPAESDALTLLAGDTSVDDDSDDDVDFDAEPVQAPPGVDGDSPCVVWQPSGDLVVFPDGADEDGAALSASIPRVDFGDEIGTDRAVLALMDLGWVPQVDDAHTWREVGDVWAMNVQPRVTDDTEQFFGRYTADDQTLVVTRAGADTDNDDEHLQLIVEGIDVDFESFAAYLQAEGWVVDVESEAAADISVHPELSESPGWYPAEAGDEVEWVCAVTRKS